MDLISGIKNIKYGSNYLHSIIGDVDNIGENGKNLTIVTLSYNRCEATIKLLKSIQMEIPEYEGYVLLFDNNSCESEKNVLKKEIKNSTLKIELIESDINLGVAGGRNAAIQMIKTEWFMSLDNDIYFINNPLIEIRKTIAMLGCKFLNMPLLSETGEKIFSNGGHIYIESFDEGVHIGCGSMFDTQTIVENYTFESSLGTFLFGGASVLNRETFINCGMFDSNMFIGFEDTDFSISVFKQGYKIGNCGMFSLIHDHTINENENYIEYEKKRFSSKVIMDSAKYFEEKHGLKVWNKNVENWLKEKHKLLNLEENSPYIIRPKIALIVDTDDWAFSNISKQIIKNLSNKYDFKYIVMKDFDNLLQVLLLAKNCDLIHFFWRGPFININSDYVYEYLKKLGITNQKEYISNLVKNLNISTSVYDHLYLENNALVTRKILNNVKNYYVSSNKLMQIYKKINGIKKPKTVITDGVDLNKFYPINIDRFDKLNKRKIVIGWVGNSKWSDEIEDFKGVNTILKPAINELIKEGYPIKMFFADRNEKMISHEEMVNYYSKIDLYICISKIEGTPNPVLESMACGVPIISTDVGIVPDVFGVKQNKFIIQERSVESLKSMIKYILSDKSIFKELSNENLKQIRTWTWEEKVIDFDKYFEKCLWNREAK